MGQKIAIFYQYLALASISWAVACCQHFDGGYSTYASFVSRDQQTLPRHASMNLVYDKAWTLRQDNRTEFNCTH